MCVVLVLRPSALKLPVLLYTAVHSPLATQEQLTSHINYLNNYYVRMTLVHCKVAIDLYINVYLYVFGNTGLWGYIRPKASRT